MRKSLAVLSIMVVCFLGSGCASFPKHRLPDMGQLPPLEDQSQAVKAGYRFTSGMELGVGGRKDFPQRVRRLLENEFTAVLKESGYFASLQQGEEGGIRIDADVVNYGNAIAAGVGGFLSGFTFCTIPCWATDNFRLKVKVMTSQGEQKEYLLDDAMTTFFWLPMIVATPFKGPWKVAPQVRRNMYENLILQMQKDGVLPPARKPVQTSLSITVEIEPVV